MSGRPSLASIGVREGPERRATVILRKIAIPLHIEIKNRCPLSQENAHSGRGASDDFYKTKGSRALTIVTKLAGVARR